MSNSEQSEPPRPDALKTLAQLQIERLKREDEEDQWISGEELYTEGSSDEDDAALKRRSAGKVPRKNLKGAIAKERKHGIRKSQCRPASVSPSRLHIESTKLLPNPELALPESQLQHLSLSQTDDSPRSERMYVDSADYPKQGTSSSCSLQTETDDEQPEISWRPKRGSIKLPNLTPEGKLKISGIEIIEDTKLSYLEVIEELKLLHTNFSSDSESIMQETVVEDKTIESKILNIKKEDKFYFEYIKNIDLKFPMDDINDNIKSAFLKINKLDALLQLTEDKEREAYEETLNVQLWIREELEQLSECQGPQSSELTKNTASFLELCSLSWNRGKMKGNTVPKMINPNTNYTNILNQDNADNLNLIAESPECEHQEIPIFKTEPHLLDKMMEENRINKDMSTKVSNMKKKPDFILRNIKLASEGMGTLSITDEEKQKLSELLKDLDNDNEVKNCSSLAKNQLDGAQGYSMDTEIQKLLKEIDSKLEIVSTKNQSHERHIITSPMRNNEIPAKNAVEEDNIRSWRMSQELRLSEIEESLNIYSEPMKEEVDPLEAEELQRLVEVCCSSSSMRTLEDASLEPSSVTSTAGDNTQLIPILALPEDITQLVQQAKNYMPYFKFRHVM